RAVLKDAFVWHDCKRETGRTHREARRLHNVGAVSCFLPGEFRSNATSSFAFCYRKTGRTIAAADAREDGCQLGLRLLGGRVADQRGSASDNSLDREPFERSRQRKS